jgi:hypothetical protein
MIEDVDEICKIDEKIKVIDFGVKMVRENLMEYANKKHELI